MMLQLCFFLYLSFAFAQSDCWDIDGGNWRLVRHTYNQWHPATDNLEGTDVYGTFGTPTSSWPFSVRFDHLLTAGTEVLFGNGDCSEYLIVTAGWLTGPRAVNPYLAPVSRKIEFNPDPTPGVYTSCIGACEAYFYYRAGAISDADPWIGSTAVLGLTTISTATPYLLYGEDDNIYHQSRVYQKSYNVFIRCDSCRMLVDLQKSLEPPMLPDPTPLPTRRGRSAMAGSEVAMPLSLAGYSLSLYDICVAILALLAVNTVLVLIYLCEKRRPRRYIKLGQTSDGDMSQSSDTETDA